MDWGYASPFCVGWYAIAAETINHPVDGRVIKHGTLIKYREWYGISTRDDGSFIPNTGLRLNADAVAHGIKDRDNGEKISYGVLDPSAFAQDGGPSIAEQMALQKVIFLKADNRRTGKEGAAGGWLQMRYRITGPIEKMTDGVAEYKPPGLMIFNTCLHTIRTIPEIEHDERNPEDVMKKGEDHCFTGDTLVELKEGPVPISEIPESGDVWSIDGLQKYRSARLTRRNAQLVKLTFDDGTQIKCTPDHRFMSIDGLVPARLMLDEISYGYQLCNQSKSARPFSYTRAKTIIGADSIFRKEAFDYIGSFTRTFSETYRKAFTFITKIMTDPIINPLIWRPFHQRNIVLSIGRQSEQRNPANVLISTEIRRPLGMDRQKEDVGIQSIIRNLFDQAFRKKLPKHAKSAEQITKPSIIGEIYQNIATPTVKPRRCVSVEDCPNEDVYCLTVPTTEMFCIEGGLLVHNCADETRYACMSRPITGPTAPLSTSMLQQPSFNDLIAENKSKKRQPNL